MIKFKEILAFLGLYYRQASMITLHYHVVLGVTIPKRANRYRQTESNYRKASLLKNTPLRLGKFIGATRFEF